MSEVLELEIGGVKYKFGRIGFGIRLEAEEEVRKQRRIEFRHVLESLQGLEGKHAEIATLEAFDKLLRNVSVSSEEVQSYLASSSGSEFQIWESLRSCDESIPRETARKIVTQATPEQFAQTTDFLRKSLGEGRILHVSEEDFVLLTELFAKRESDVQAEVANAN
jgi:hypothetical protein